MCLLSMMHTTARADRKGPSAKKALCTSRLATTVQGLCFPIVSSSIMTNPTAPGDHYAHTKALRTLMLLQAAHLKCALAQTRHRVPDSRASPSRHVNKTMCTHHSEVLMKQYAYHCEQNGSGQAQSKIYWVNVWLQTYIHSYRDASHTTY